MASASFAKLRRLAPRSIRVLERRAAGSPAIGAFAQTLDAKAKAYIAAYDASAKYRRIYAKETSEGHSAIEALRQSMKAWAPALSRDVPSFDAADALAGRTVPDDVLAAAEKLIQVADDAQRGDGVTLSYGAALLEDMGGTFAAAVKEWGEADAADKERQDLLKATREGGALFDAELQLFRRVLLAVGGRSDKDYQKLRAEKASLPDEDDDGAVEAGGASVAGAGEPVAS